jgi:hypothetical protein
MNSSLVAHAGANKITRAELALIETPKPTDTFRPIAHDLLVSTLVETLSFRQIKVVKDEYAVTADGAKMFGLLELDATFLDCRFSIGIRNAHDKSMRLGLVAGYRVFVCDNMAFSGEYKPLLAKHSKHFDLIQGVSVGVDKIQRNFQPLAKQVEAWRTNVLDDQQAKTVIYDAFVLKGFPKHAMTGVHQHYFEPKYDEFQPRNFWSLSNAFTSAFKELKPVAQYQATAKLGKFLGHYQEPIDAN